MCVCVGGGVRRRVKWRYVVDGFLGCVLYGGMGAWLAVDPLI